MQQLSRARRVLSVSTALAVAVATGLSAGLTLGVSTASADTPAGSSTGSTAPVVDRDTSTVTAAPLPTVQIDSGIVWAQTTIGNTVYVGGQFSNARPAGAAKGTNLTARNNMLAYDITTGNLVTGFDPNVKGTIKAIAVSPDKTRVYIGGDFVAVGGVTESRIVALDARTGAVISSFNAGTDATVTGLAATNSTVYAGGYFSTADGVGRTRLAAFSASTGALTTWAPTADDDIDAMVMSPDNTKVVIGGKFQNVSGSAQQGITALDAGTGAVQPWAANQVVKNGNTQSGTYSLSVDNDTVYGSSFNYGTGNFEGIFAMKASDGSIVWLDDCHGDTYASYSMNNVVYNAGHAHNCANINSFPEHNPRYAWRAMAFTKAATQTVQANSQGGLGNGYGDFAGQPAPSTVYWFPQFTIGTVTNQDQAVWSLTGNGTYLSAGGEFPSLNGKAQYGLVRFGPSTVAGANTSGVTQLGGVTNPSLKALGSNAVRVTWPANWDRDDRNLTYQVIRKDLGTTKPVNTRTVQSTFWQLPGQGYTDTSLQPGTTYQYKILVSDPNGNGTTSDYVSVTTPTSGTFGQYSQTVLNDGAVNYYRLDDSTSSTMADLSSGNNLTTGSGVNANSGGALIGDSNGSANFTNATGTGQTTATTGPQTFTAETWIRTTSTTGGKIIGFGSSASGSSSSYDRHVYMDNTGHLTFGVYPGGVRTLTTPETFNDGQWHYVVAELSPAGMNLYVDGVQEGTDASTTGAQSYPGYWRLGADNLAGWPNAGSNSAFTGDIDETAIYPTALSVTQIRNHYALGGYTTSVPAQPQDSYGATVYNDNPTLFWRLNDSSGPAIADSGVNRQPGVASGGVSYGTSSPVAPGTADSFNGSDATISSTKAQAGPSTYSEELWFNTTTSSGGKLIGFGDQQSGRSGNYDRHVYMENSGQLTFGTYTGQLNTATSPNSYNDGSWHYLVATQGSDGMKLYVDGAVVATNAQTGAQSYNGYWRVGGDSDWGGDSAFLNGSIDEVAVYPTALTAQQVKTHYQASPAAVNAPPTASFTTSCQNGTCSFDGSASNDPDGTIQSSVWDFGDGTTGTGATIIHPYAKSGSYPVTLTVTDNSGAKATASKTVTITVDQPPTASFTSTAADLTASFDGSGSSDPDGTVASYAWNFGDNSTDNGPTPKHSYVAAGTYSVTLTVADDQGATDTVTKSVTVAKSNVAPTASFSSTSVDLKASFDGSGSSDPDGTVASYAWDFGDNATGTGQTTSHTYAAAGSYSVKLTVTDNSGATNTVTKSVTVAKSNVAPTASFSSTSVDLKASFDGSGSSDPDGTVASYAWDFGDNATGTGQTTSHTYAAAGSYSVKLTVTDNSGATNTVTKSVTVAKSNVAPTASFSSTSVDLKASFDGSGSSDPDGTVASYAWDFGDNATGTGQTTSHTYAAAGSYSVKLTVTDNSGATNTVTKSVTVTAPTTPTSPTVANDTFTRSTSSGWGTADTGGTWVLTGGNSNFATAGGVGTMKLGTNSTDMAALDTVSAANVVVTGDTSVDKIPNGSGVATRLLARKSGNTFYWLKVIYRSDNTVHLAEGTTVNNSEVVIKEVAISNLTYSANAKLRAKFTVSGTSTATLTGKVWAVGSTEPGANQISVTDSNSALTSAGGVGVRASTTSNTTTVPISLSVDNFSAVKQ